MIRALFTLIFAVISLGAGAATAEAAGPAKMYKNPQCGCCEEYAKYLERNGFDITIEPTLDLATIKRLAGVPSKLEACHTLAIDGYVVEGHVPVDTLNRLLAERPKIRGIALPGMPMGSPGMTGTKAGQFTIYEISEGVPEVYAVE
jgi:hypothetical protein